MEYQQFILYLIVFVILLIVVWWFFGHESMKNIRGIVNPTFRTGSKEIIDPLFKTSKQNKSIIDPLFKTGNQKHY